MRKTLDYPKGMILHLLNLFNRAPIPFIGKPFKPLTRLARPCDGFSLEHKAERLMGELKGGRWLRGPEKEFYWYEDPCTLGDGAMWQGWALYTAVMAKDWELAAQMMKGVKKLVYLGGNARIKRGADMARDSGGTFQWDSNRKYYQNGGYEYFDDCSESSLLGLMFGLWSVMEHAPEQNDLCIAAKHTIVDLAEQIVRDDMQLINHDGTPSSKFGNLKDKVFEAPIRVGAGACLMLLAWDASREEKYKEKYLKIARGNLGTITHTESHLLWFDAKFDDILSYMLYAMLISREYVDLDLRHAYRAALREQWAKNKLEANSMFYALKSMTLNEENEEEERQATLILSEFDAADPSKPRGKTKGSVNATDRYDTTVWGFGKKKRLVSLEPVAPWEGPPKDWVWQRGMYSVKGAESHDYNSMDFLAAYYTLKSMGAV